mmetsp:Transcript_19761/g.50185  ORF Transcript_19761/g.50185 Transcript_19761/m.50185 type:complete len:876 (-) Transcript_19761:188-2815(-)|eukprot:CAMPEP_0177644588 /NCGR_PEP_ID=MMETSP0447-20121125/8771_1 /TAXON_ID=0 /ORGANISM="Stygamoeba regulata, Strain BSH-02190019" /LENGTH=875 /DNA_ID=CAMNT_0019146965 /DNA_START=80 /DNA_END=2707 /DNA_ORIENTATION=-
MTESTSTPPADQSTAIAAAKSYLQQTTEKYAALALERYAQWSNLTLAQAEELKNRAFQQYQVALEKYATLKAQTNAILQNAKLTAEQKRAELTAATLAWTGIDLDSWKNWATESLEKAHAWSLQKAELVVKNAEAQVHKATRLYMMVRTRALADTAAAKDLTVQSAARLKNQAWEALMQTSEQVAAAKLKTQAILDDARLTTEEKRKQLLDAFGDLTGSTQQKVTDLQSWSFDSLDKGRQWLLTMSEEARHRAEERYVDALSKYELAKQSTFRVTSETLQSAEGLKEKSAALYEDSRQKYLELRVALSKILSDTSLTYAQRQAQLVSAVSQSLGASAGKAEELQKWASESLEQARQWAVAKSEDLLQSAEERYHYTLAQYEALRARTEAAREQASEKVDQLREASTQRYRAMQERYEHYGARIREVYNNTALSPEEKKSQLYGVALDYFKNVRTRLAGLEATAASSVEKYYEDLQAKLAEWKAAAQVTYDHTQQNYEQLVKRASEVGQTAQEAAHLRAEGVKNMALEYYKESIKEYEELKSYLDSVVQDTKLSAQEKRDAILKAITEMKERSQYTESLDEVRTHLTENVERGREMGMRYAQGMVQRAEHLYNSALVSYASAKAGMSRKKAMTLQDAEEMRASAYQRVQTVREGLQRAMTDNLLSAEQRREQIAKLLKSAFESTSASVANWNEWLSLSLEHAAQKANDAAQELHAEAESYYNRMREMYADRTKIAANAVDALEHTHAYLYAATTYNAVVGELGAYGYSFAGSLPLANIPEDCKPLLNGAAAEKCVEEAAETTGAAEKAEEEVKEEIKEAIKEEAEAEGEDVHDETAAEEANEDAEEDEIVDGGVDLALDVDGEAGVQDDVTPGNDE